MSSKRLKKAVQENYSNHFKSETEESVGCFIICTQKMWVLYINCIYGFITQSGIQWQVFVD